MIEEGKGQMVTLVGEAGLGKSRLLYEFEKWIEMYNHEIGLFGGIDVNTLCLKSYDEVYREVLEKKEIRPR